jgi:hypothetical protein
MFVVFHVLKHTRRDAEITTGDTHFYIRGNVAAAGYIVGGQQEEGAVTVDLRKRTPIFCMNMAGFEKLFFCGCPCLVDKKAYIGEEAASHENGCESSTDGK